VAQSADPKGAKDTEVKDKVWVELSNLSIPHPSNNLLSSYSFERGPFKGNLVIPSLDMGDIQAPNLIMTGQAGFINFLIVMIYKHKTYVRTSPSVVESCMMSPQLQWKRRLTAPMSGSSKRMICGSKLCHTGAARVLASQCGTRKPTSGSRPQNLLSYILFPKVNVFGHANQPL